ncbi:unnamed protein product, partial [Polarella glacialis]
MAARRLLCGQCYASGTAGRWAPCASGIQSLARSRLGVDGAGARHLHVSSNARFGSPVVANAVDRRPSASTSADAAASSTPTAAASSTPVEEKKATPTAAASLGQLWQILKPERGRLQLALGALCASSAVNLSYPYLMGRLVDLFGSGAEGLNFVLEQTYMCGGIVLFGGLATFCRLYLIETAIERISFRLRREFFSALIRRPIAFFDVNKTGELVNRLSNDITVTSRVLIDVSGGLRSAITAVVGTCMVFQLAPTEMMVGLLSPIAALFVVGMGYGRVVRQIAERRQSRLAEAVQHAEERLSGIRTVRTFNAESRELRSFEQLLDRVYAAGRQSALATGGLSCLFVTGGGMFLLHIVYNCGVMVSGGIVSIGTTVSLAMYCFMAGASYTGMMSSYGEIQKCLGACTKVLDILEANGGSKRQGTSDVVPTMTQKVVAAAGIAAQLPPMAVRFEDVSFTYPNRPEVPVLQGLDLDIPAGARVALLGRSGSGKSTVALMLAGLYEPSAGRIFVDGEDMFARPEGAALVRSQLGVISQEPTLFALSIRDNVAYGLGSETRDDDAAAIQDAISAAHVEEFTQLLPQGLDTPSGERGQSLSGGQK